MTITRRLFLSNVAATGAIGANAAVPAALAAPSEATAHPWRDENPALIEAWKQFRAAEKESREAKDALEWLYDEWRHLWPLAPEELLGAWNMHEYDPFNRAERDILGHPLMRDTTVLTRRLSAKRRAEGGQQCFAVTSTDELMEDLDRWQRNKPTGRTERALARNRAWKAQTLRRLRNNLTLARVYEAETARLREAAGVEAAKARLTVARQQKELLAHRVSIERPFTLYGVRLQADVALFTLGRYCGHEQDAGPFGEALRLAGNIMDATAHLDRGRNNHGEGLS